MGKKKNKRASDFLGLVEFKGEPCPQKRGKTGAHFATGVGSGNLGLEKKRGGS